MVRRGIEGEVEREKGRGREGEGGREREGDGGRYPGKSIVVLPKLSQERICLINRKRKGGGAGGKRECAQVH